MTDMTLCASLCPLSHECQRHATQLRIDRVAQSFALFEPHKARECYGYTPPRGVEVVASE